MRDRLFLYCTLFISLTLCPLFIVADTIDFADMTWTIKEGMNKGPGNNNWHRDCVWLDEDDCLHLAITNISGTWYCGEVFKSGSLGYGEYRWYINNRVDALFTNAVGGLFTYQYIPGLDATTNEIDIEFTRAFSVGGGSNLNYTVQPYTYPDAMYKNNVLFTNEQTTHRFIWSPGRIDFQSWYGHSEEPPADGPFDSWTCTASHVPGPGVEGQNMNLWLFQTKVPQLSDTNLLEMVIKDFVYVDRKIIDFFDDNQQSNVWTTFGDLSGNGILETNDILRVNPVNAEDWSSLGYRSQDALSRNQNYQYVLSSVMTTVMVSHVSTNQDADIYGIQALVSGPRNGNYDPFWASNAIALKSGYDSDSDEIRLECFTKTDAPQNNGTLRFEGVISNFAAYAATGGLEFRLSLESSYYYINAYSGTTEVDIATTYGFINAPHQMGTTITSAYYLVGAQNGWDGRGYVFWDQTRVFDTSDLITSKEGSNTVYGIDDDFDDGNTGAIWTEVGNYGSATYEEIGSDFRVRPGTEAWQTSAYVTQNPLLWNDDGGIFTFSAVLSTIQVSTAQSGVDCRLMLSLVTEQNNSWVAASSMSLQGMYDQAGDSLNLVLMSKLDNPSHTETTQRYNGTINNVSSYLNPTNHLNLSIILGKGKYVLDFTDYHGGGVPITTSSGALSGLHNMSTNLHRCFWLVGSQNESTGRGYVYWGRTVVSSSPPPNVVCGTPVQTSTDASGIITFTNQFYDYEGDQGRLKVEVSVDGGSSWFKPWIASLSGSLSAELTATESDWQVVDIATTNMSSQPATNTLVMTWDTLSSSNSVDLSDQSVTNTCFRLTADDEKISGDAVTSVVFIVDNAGPDYSGATVSIVSPMPYTFDYDLASIWNGFVDEVSTVIGYYYSLSDQSGTTSGVWTVGTMGVATGAVLDATNTFYVWAADQFGNCGLASSDSILVLSATNDWDGDALKNAEEISYGADPTSRDSDSDGISDGWEVRYSLSPTNSTDGALDPDNDSYSSEEEFIAGTDPTNALSFFKLDNEVLGPSALSPVIQWQGSADRTYSVYYTDDHLGKMPSWLMLISNVNGIGGSLSVTDQTAGVDCRMYRVTVENP